MAKSRQNGVSITRTLIDDNFINIFAAKSQIHKYKNMKLAYTLKSIKITIIKYTKYSRYNKSWVIIHYLQERCNKLYDLNENRQEGNILWPRQDHVKRL